MELHSERQTEQLATLNTVPQKNRKEHIEGFDSNKDIIACTTESTLVNIWKWALDVKSWLGTTIKFAC